MARLSPPVYKVFVHSGLFERGGALERTLPAFEPRASQREMSVLVERALEQRGVALIEAGTGTGKTLAYLAPALASSHRRVVVSTGTRALQDQILEHDIPILERALGAAVSVAVLKGLSNYVCRRRLSELNERPTSTGHDFRRALPVVNDFAMRSSSGDITEADALEEDAAIWQWVTSSSETRIGTRCRFHDSCFVSRARARANDARLVIVNHHLFFADLALRSNGRGVLPDYSAVIFDEAHRIEDIATTFFGAQVSSARIETLLRDAERALEEKHLLDSITRGLLDAIRYRTEEMFARVPRAPIDGTRLSLSSEDLARGLRDALFSLDLDVETMGDILRDRVAESDALAGLARRTGSLSEDLGSIAEPSNGSIVWCRSQARSSVIGSSPIDVSSLLRDEVLHRTRTVVFVSATLATGQSFAFTKDRLGIDFEVDEAVLTSPFDYSSQSALYLPELPDPRESTYLAAATLEIERLLRLTEGGAFLLFTSHRMKEALARALVPSIRERGWTPLVQGQAPNTALLNHFREAQHAVLFGTSSFWEGVDVPGSALRLVVIDKLPFEVPADPLVKARCERIADRGGNPFLEYLVPSAALALKQGFGRLIRTRSDRGIVAVLDSRVRKKSYGKTFLASLPPALRCTSFEDVESFWGAGSQALHEPDRQQ